MVTSSNEMSTFSRVADRGSFAAAAVDLGLSPSAVSKLITRLETRLGVRLFQRTTRRLALTAEGKFFSIAREKFSPLLKPRRPMLPTGVERPRGIYGCMRFRVLLSTICRAHYRNFSIGTPASRLSF